MKFRQKFPRLKSQLAMTPVILIALAVVSLTSTLLVFAGPLLTVYTLIALAFIAAVSTKLEGAAWMFRPMTAGSQLPGYDSLAPRPVSPSTVAIVLRNAEKIIAEVGLQTYLDALNGIASTITDAANSEVYHVDGATLVYQSERCPLKEADLIEELIAQIGAIRFGDSALDVHLHAGICNDEDHSMEKLVACAIIAAREASEARTSVRIHYSDQDRNSFSLCVLNEFKQALDFGHVWLAYQPKYNSKERRVTGAEALIRWNHPVHGAITPDAFIPLLEAAGRMDDLTQFTIDRAISDFAADQSGHDVAVNIAPCMLGSGKVLQYIADALNRHAFQAHRLVIEITETGAVNDDQIGELHAIRAMGVGIAIDDYGTGYSSVSHLKRLPATQIKLDKSLLSENIDDRRDKLIICSSIQLAHEMGMQVVAEGAEIQAQCEFLDSVGCDYVQGFILGRPMPIGEYRQQLSLSKRCAA